ncbi:MAG: hypothetical protein K2Q01_02105 [Rickettsiales bacterium]|nr:hypothetical protein [Rickettsiales bacterium]
MEKKKPEVVLMDSVEEPAAPAAAKPVGRYPLTASDHPSGITAGERLSRIDPDVVRQREELARKPGSGMARGGCDGYPGNYGE